MHKPNRQWLSARFNDIDVLFVFFFDVFFFLVSAVNTVAFAVGFAVLACIVIIDSGLNSFLCQNRAVKLLGRKPFECFNNSGIGEL